MVDIIRSVYVTSEADIVKAGKQDWKAYGSIRSDTIFNRRKPVNSRLHLEFHCLMFHCYVLGISLS